MQSIAEITNNGFYRNNSKLITTSTSIELPEEISILITGNDYWKLAKTNRYKKLIREGHLADLMLLAETALTKNSPANWFAKAASKAEWDRTLEFLAKLKTVILNAQEVAKRVVALPKNMPVIYKACWKLGSQVIQRAITAQETGRDPFKYFCWLCSKT